MDNFITEAADDKIFADSTNGIEFTLSVVEPFDYVYLSGTDDSVTNTVPVFLLGGKMHVDERAKFLTFRTAFNAFRTALIAIADMDLDPAGITLKAILMPEDTIIPDIFTATVGDVNIAYPLRVVANITESDSRRDALVFFNPRLIYVDGARVTVTGTLQVAINNVIHTKNPATTGALTGAFDTVRSAGGIFLNGELSRQDLDNFLLLTSQ